MLLERPRRRLRRDELRERERLWLPERERLRGERDRERDRDRDLALPLPVGGAGDLSDEWRPFTVLAGAGSVEPVFLTEPRDPERDFWRERRGERERGRRLERRSLEAGRAAEEEPRLRMRAAALAAASRAALGTEPLLAGLVDRERERDLDLPFGERSRCLSRRELPRCERDRERERERDRERSLCRCSSSRLSISSFFCCMNSAGMPESLSCAESSNAHSSPINWRALRPLRKPVMLICIFLGHGYFSSSSWL